MCGVDCEPYNRCGDGLCAQSESPITCAIDCGPVPPACGDGVCTPSARENCFSCPEDCDACDPGDPCAVHASPGLDDASPRNCVCAQDPFCCAVAWDFNCVILATHFCAFECGTAGCGDGECGDGESCAVCPQDCGACSLCGDGTCASHEDCASCAADCGPCLACGDGVCDVIGATEDCTSCPDDCGPCWHCPNARCEFVDGETPQLCPDDCYCGDNICLLEHRENTFTCPLDCYCGDGVCEPAAGETLALCPFDNCTE